MLTSKSTSEPGVLRFKYDSGNVVLYDTTKREEHFTVSPNPCINTGDHVRPNAYSFNKTVINWPTGQNAQYYRNQGTMYSIERSGVFGREWFTSYNHFRLRPEASNDAYNRCLSKVYADIRNSEVNLGTSIGEGRETLQMLRSIAGSAARARNELKKLRRDLVLNPLQTVGGLWLGWSVGLKPLLSDCEAIRSHLLSREPAFEFRMSKARASVTSNAQRTDGAETETAQATDRCEIGLVYRVVDPHQFENWRAGLTVRPTLVWELTTLSFVVDYFINIGQYLELMEASILNNGLEFSWGYRTDSRLCENQWRSAASNLDFPSGDFGLGSYGYHRFEASKRETKKSRGLLTSFPSPVSPSIHIPRASGPLLNIAALLAQLIRKEK